MKPGALDRLRRFAAPFGALLAVIGFAAIAAAVIADLGRRPYIAGAVLLVVGLCLVLARLVRNRVGLVASCLVVALAVGGGAWLGLDGLPDQHESWDDATPDDGDLAAGTFREGRVLYSEGAAHDISTGEVLWRAPKRSRLLTATDEVAILAEAARGDGEPRVIARLLDSGHQVWWAEVGTGPAAIAYHQGILVLTSDRGTTGIDMTSGAQLWNRAGVGGTECRGGKPYEVKGADLEQQGVFLPSKGKKKTVDVVRVDDGTVAAREVGCSDAGRIVDTTIVQHGKDSIIGRSLTTGDSMWERPADWSGRRLQLADAGGFVFVPVEDGDGEVPAGTYRGLDLHSGEVTDAVPPSGWTAKADVIGGQRADVLWQPVRRDGEAGLWQVGTSRVVAVPDATSIEVAEADASGWVALVGSTKDPVGTPVRATWAVSPEGTLYGPFRGRDAEGTASIAAGVLRIGSRIFPLD